MAKKPSAEIASEVLSEEETLKIRADERFAKRRFTDDTAPSALAVANVERQWWPTKVQYKKLWMYVMPEMGVTPEGWWYACCPVHDPNVNGAMSALFNFSTGSMRCLADPSCHPAAKAMTLNNAIMASMSKLTGDDVQTTTG